MRTVTNLEKLVEGFRLYCLAEGKAAKTIGWYIPKLVYLREYLEGNGLPSDVSKITVNHLRAFVVHLKTEVTVGQNNPYRPTTDKPLSPLTVAGYVRVLKLFFNWVKREGYVENNPGRLLRVPKTPTKIVETFANDQIRQLLGAVDIKKTNGFRDLCMMLLFLDTGIRLTELVTLEIPDMDLERGEIKIRGKGGKERIVPIGGKVQKALWKYVHRYRVEPAHPNVKNLFLSIQGYGLSGSRVYRIISDYGEKAGLEGVRCSPHTFRHTFAKNFLINGGDLFTLQKILGHSSLNVVRLYVNLTHEDLKVQHRKYSPVDVMGVKV
jgi:integrase/recombinase XerD